VRAALACATIRHLRVSHDRPVSGIMWVIFDHLRPAGHIMPVRWGTGGNAGGVEILGRARRVSQSPRDVVVPDGGLAVDEVVVILGVKDRSWAAC